MMYEYWPRDLIPFWDFKYDQVSQAGTVDLKFELLSFGFVYADLEPDQCMIGCVT